MGVLNPTGYKKKKLNQNYNNSQIMQEDYSWCPSTVRNILKNDIYIGNITQGKKRVKSYKVHKVEQVPEDEWITVENMHEPIIEKELFEKAQELRKVDTRVQNSGALSMWAGILKCADCGRAMHKKYCKNKSGTVYEYYICGTYRKKSNKLCTKHTLKVEELEKAVLEAIKLHIELLVDTKKLLEQINKSATQKLANENTPNIRKVASPYVQIASQSHVSKKLNLVSSEKSSDFSEEIKQTKEKEIVKLNNLKRCLYEDWKNDYITKEEYLEYKQKYEQDIKKIKEIMANLDNQKEKQEEIINGNSLWIERFKEHKNITKLDRDIITELIDYIEVHEDKNLTRHSNQRLQSGTPEPCCSRNKKITIHFKFMNELNKILEYIEKEE